jgi:hypothetical protein
MVNDSNDRSGSNDRADLIQKEKSESIVFGAGEVPWCDRIENYLIQVNPTIGVESVKSAVQANRFKALEVFINDASIGFVIARIDTLVNGSRQFVVMHTLSDIKGRTPLVMIASVLLEQLAKKYVCDSVCCFSDRLGWDGVLKRAGYKYKESIFIKEVNQ